MSFGDFVQLQLRAGTAAQWESANPVLAVAEPGVESDTLKMKLGDGSTPWATLPYAISGSTSAAATFAATVGNGTSTSFSVVHSLGTEDVIVGVIDLTTMEIVYPTVTIIDVNTVSVQFSVAPSANEMRVLVVKA